MALERFYNLPRARREALLGTAAKRFAAEGYDGTSFNQLLAELGLSKSQAYYYFQDKADLFTTACAACYEEFYEQADALALPQSRDGFWEYVLELNRLGCWFQQSHPIAADLTRAAAHSLQRTELARASVSQAGSTRQRYGQWLDLGQGLGAVRSDLPREFLISLCIDVATCMDVWFAGQAAAASSTDLEAWAQHMTDLSRRMLEPVATAPTKARAPTTQQRRKRAAR